MPPFRKLTLADNHPVTSILFAQRESKPNEDAIDGVDPFYCSTDSDLEYGSELEDHDYPWEEDITLRPKTAIQRSKPSSRQRRRQRSLAVVKPPSIHPRAIPLTPMTTKPLVFPLEVLEMVCRYLSQATLRFSASLVSRQWNVVCNPFIKRTVIWKAFSDEYDQFVLDTLRDVDSLECWLHEDPDMSSNWLPYMKLGFRLKAWETFWPKLLTPIKQSNCSIIDSGSNTNGADNDNNLCLMDTIRHLRLFCQPNSRAVTYFDGLQPHFRSLRSLEFKISGNVIGSLSLFTLLDNSPQLVQLKIMGPRHYQWNLIAGDDEDNIIDPPELEFDPDTAHFPVKPKVIIPPNKSYAQRYKLEVFDAFLVNVHQRVLERLISTCPNLRILKVLEANARIWVPQQGYVTWELKHQRLFDHANDCCPRLVSIEVLRRVLDESDLDYFRLTAKLFPDASMLTLNCYGYMPEAAGLEARRLLSQITFLHIRHVDSLAGLNSNLDRILCLTPRLLHFISSELLLDCKQLELLPAAEVVQERPQFITHNRTRKNAVREERRSRRRESLLAIERASERARLAREASGSNPLPDVPLYWQCHDLRTLDVHLHALPRFGEYIQQHQLFRKLTSLKLRVQVLNVGQYISIPDCKKLPTGAKAKSKKGVGQKGRNTMMGTTTEVHLGFSQKAVIPKRHENDLENLQDLPSLELLVIYTMDLPGMVHHSDFEFLRRVPPPVVPAEALNMGGSSSSSSPSLPTTSGTVVFAEDMVTFSPAEAQCTEPHLEESRKELQGQGQTCWPRLQMFKIRYHYSKFQSDYSKVVAGMERIRPGVEFQIKLMPNYVMNCH